MTSDDEKFDPREMDSVHTMFRREFSLMGPLVRGVAPTDHARTSTVADHIDLFVTSLREHHGFEDDRIWPALLERVGPHIAPDVHRAASQHSQLEGALAHVEAALAPFRGATADSGTGLAVALDLLLPILLGHMDFEEAHVVPLMQTHVTQAEWDQGLAELGGSIDPKQLPLLFGLQMYETDSAVIDLTVAKMPQEVQRVIRAEAPRMFAEYARRIHGTAKPPRSTDIATQDP